MRAVRAALLIGPQQIDVVDVAEPPLLSGSVLVAIQRCGVGGSDLEAWRTGDLPSPAWFGHEWSGRIIAVGEGVVDRFEGERVVGATAPPCGLCPPCRAGFGPRCRLSLAMIVGTDPLASTHGAFAEVIRVDARRVHRVPEGISDDDAALTEPAAVAAHAVARSGQRLGDLVTVIGAGTIGLLVAELARLTGAARVVAVDRSSDRGELACSLGADAAFVPGPGVTHWLGAQGHGLGADVVYVCTADPLATAEAVHAVRPGGTVVLVGAGSEPVAVSPRELVAREVTLRASLGYGVADVHRALELMADDRVMLDAMWDRVVGFGDIAEVVARQSAGPSSGRKMLFAPDR